jgi:hypothetical protein
MLTEIGGERLASSGFHAPYHKEATIAQDWNTKNSRRRFEEESSGGSGMARFLECDGPKLESPNARG